MRYLNKIVFINSAHVPYAEVALDGNVHFIGTQGVGKSTLLRAILFFYNADKGNLGIGREQKSFDDFYLPHPDSYIIYEVTRENGKFFVMLFKSQGRAAYRIVDCAYDKCFFVEADGRVRHQWGDISTEIGPKVEKSSIIRHYQEFRDILYGNVQAVAKDLRRYHLMESAKYQNVPRTIQNIFLNQSLESRVIKDTIISSMDFASDSLELSFYRAKTQDFRRRYEDTWKWYRKEKNGKIKVVEDAKRVDNNHAEYIMTNRRIAGLTACLLYAMQRDKDLLPRLQQKEMKASAELERQHRLLSEEKGKYESERDKHNRRIGQLDDKLKQTKERRVYWDKSDIKRIFELHTQKSAMEVESASLKKKYDTLVSSGSDIRDKYDKLIQNEQQKLAQLLTTLREQQLEIQQQFMEKKEARLQLLHDTKQKRAEKAAKDDAVLFVKIEEIQAQLNELQLRYMKVSHTNPNEEKLQAVEERLKNLEERKHRLEVDMEAMAGKDQQIVSETEAKCKAREVEHDKAVSLLEQDMDKLHEQLAELVSLLERQEGSLIRWLSENVSGWEDTLGKVLDENAVLYNTQLSPQLMSNADDSLMGISINLSQVERPVRTPQQLLNEKAKVEKAIADLKNRCKQMEELLRTDIESIKKKPSEVLRKLRSEKKVAETELRFLPVQIERQYAERIKLLDEAETWRNKQRDEIEQEKVTLSVQCNKLKEQRKLLAERKRREENDLNREYDKWLKEEERLKQTETTKLDAQKKQFERDVDAQKQLLTAQMDCELRGMGVDAKRLQELRGRIERIKADLDYLENNQKNYYDWLHDNKELFDYEIERRTELKAVKQLVEDLSKRFSEREERLKKTITQLSNDKREAAERNKQLCDNLKRAEDFVQANHRELPSADSAQEEKSLEEIPVLLDDLRDQINYRQRTLNDFKHSVDVFIANFSAQNTFSFPTNLFSEADYVNFAVMLHEFVSMRKMDEVRVRTTELYTDITQRIARKMEDLMNHNSQVQKTISDINRDFRENNFAGVIKDIQLRAEPSNDRLTQLFLKITDFVHEAQMDLGEFNLFSDENQREANNVKAVQLLEALIHQLDAEPKREYITLADTFKLEFKVKENDNDTSWVEKLSNVGSDGTDILVKAMVNIMLINVFKSKESKKFGDFRLHCMMDEIGKLHPNNVKGILEFANKRNIYLINSSPTTYIASAYRYTYTLSKDKQSNTIVKSLLTVQ